MEVTTIEPIPLSHTLPEGEGLGDARGFGRDRATTLLRLETDTGLVGWGEAFVPGPMAEATVAELFVDDVVGMGPFDVDWIEEPVPPENLSGYREVAAHVDTAIAAGEAHYGRFEFKRLTDGAVDVVQPNLARCGGLSEARTIAKLATTENVGVRPHVWNSAVGLAAAVQFAASVPTYPHSRTAPDPMLVEFDRSENSLRTDLLETPFDPSGGELAVPQEPGLGIEVDEDAVAEYRNDR